MEQRMNTGIAIVDEARPQDGMKPSSRRVLHETKAGFEVDDAGLAVLAAVRSGSDIDELPEKPRTIHQDLIDVGMIVDDMVHPIIDRTLGILEQSLLWINLAISTEESSGTHALTVGDEGSILTHVAGPSAGYRLYSHQETLPALIDYLEIGDRPRYDSPVIEVDAAAIERGATTTDVPEQAQSILLESGVPTETAELVVQLLQECPFSVRATAYWQISPYSYAKQSFSFLDGGRLGYWAVSTRGADNNIVQLQPIDSDGVGAGIRSLFTKARHT